jgi:hypothetical protein
MGGRFPGYHGPATGTEDGPEGKGMATEERGNDRDPKKDHPSEKNGKAPEQVKKEHLDKLFKKKA